MGRWGAAFRIFFRTLSSAEVAARVTDLLTGQPVLTGQPALPPADVATPKATPSSPTHTPEAGRLRPPAVPAFIPGQEALLLLATLQREARLIDFLKEDLSAYADEQVGAAAREVHRDAAATLERLLALRPIVEQPEGSQVDVPSAGAAAGMIRLTGAVAGSGPFRGALRHPGWQASKVELPVVTGSATALRAIAPAEVEVGG